MASYHGSRSAKYRHLLDDALGLAPDERALLCVLMLRGPQTPGELRQRSERLHEFPDLGAAEDALEPLTARELGRSLERPPGQKAAQYEHLVQGADDHSGSAEEVTQGGPAGEIAQLRDEVRALREEVAALRAELGA